MMASGDRWSNELADDARERIVRREEVEGGGGRGGGRRGSAPALAGVGERTTLWILREPCEVRGLVPLAEHDVVPRACCWILQSPVGLQLSHYNRTLFEADSVLYCTVCLTKFYNLVCIVQFRIPFTVERVHVQCTSTNSILVQ